MDGYSAPNRKQIAINTSVDSLLSDDFGGSAINGANWDVIPGGIVIGTALASNPTQPSAVNIGSGVSTGFTQGVAGSALSIGMGTTNGAEYWLLSTQVFCGKEDILLTLSKTQAIAANSIFIGMVEVDPITGLPLLNPNLAGDFTNRGGAELGLTAVSTLFTAEAIGDSSSTKATSAGGVSAAGFTTSQEVLIEIDSRDIIVSTSLVDSVASKASGSQRVSSQAPNDKKLYKLLLRFKNVSVPGSSTTVAIGRILVIDNYEMRVQLSSGEGDTIGTKSVGVNVNNTPAVTVAAGTANIGAVSLIPSASFGASTFHKLIAAATTNATSVKATAGTITGGFVFNASAAVKYLKFFNKASAPVLGTDTPVITIPIPANGFAPLGDILLSYGIRFTTGIAYAITGASADADATALAAGDVILGIVYA